MHSLTHIYIGDGKGKTTAAMGLAIRAAGRNLNVVAAQFLKSDDTGELNPLKKLGITVIRSSVRLGFVFKMNDVQKELCRAEQSAILAQLQDYTNTKKPDVIILDEVIDALNTQMLSQKELCDFIAAADAELVLTGRNPPDWLIKKADYITEMRKIKHPFDRDVPARPGIEY